MSSSAEHVFDLSTLSDSEVAAILKDKNIGLTVPEARRLQTEILGRAPSLAECILFGIEGSEHCSYKSSRNLLKQFITEGEEVILGAKEDAGVIRVARDASGKGYAIIMSHESHNHPSQLVPYEGAATGVGGNVRDVCCMGGEVIAQADDLRFGSLDNPKNKWIYEGVVSGIAGYGNPIGVPSIGGGLQFDPGYDDNCLVTVVTLGIVEEDAIVHSYAPEEADGYDLILVGKPTDNSGFGGASFASFVLDDDKKEMNKGAVQEPNAFLGRHMIKASVELFKILKNMQVLDRVGFKDLGAGGIACASVELADTSGYGARVDVDKIHVAMEGLPPEVILCAETQERYMWVSPPELTPIILKHYNETFALPQISRGAAAVVIGSITKDPAYIVTAGGKDLVNAPACQVTKGFLYDREQAPEKPVSFSEPDFPVPSDLSRILFPILSHENVASRAPLYENYDKQVQGRTIVEAGMGDSGVIRPFGSPDFPREIQDIGITLTTDQNPRQNSINAKQGGINAVAEAFCNTAASGARAIALSDCLCYGNPEKPNQMRQFADGCRGVAEASAALGVPVIAGNVSLYNESGSGAIPPSPMIAVLGKLKDYKAALTPGFKAPHEDLLLIGERKDECGGSIYYDLFQEKGTHVPAPELNQLKAAAEVIAQLAEEHRIEACHDISEGGAAAALAEMAIYSQVSASDQTGNPVHPLQCTGTIGCSVELPGEPGLRIDKTLFSESFGFLIACKSEHTTAIKKAFSEQGVAVYSIGTTTETPVIAINSVISVTVEEARKAFLQGLREKLA